MYAGPSLQHRPTIQSENVVLRRPQVFDTKEIADILNDWQVAKCLSHVPYPYTLVDAHFFLDHIVPNEWVWAINESGSPKLIGSVSLMPRDGSDVAELGYWLSRDYWGRGLITEAARLVVDYGFKSLQLACITSGCFKDNVASARVLEKLGFVANGRSKRPGPARSGDLPGIDMVLHPPDVQAMR